MKNKSRENYYDREDELVEKSCLDPTEARYIARLEDGWSESEIMNEFGLSTTLSIQKSIERYEQYIEESKWILNNGPDPEKLKSNNS